jgi:hypothetical protein
VLQVRATSCTRTRATAANISNARAAGPASRAVPPTLSLIRSSRQGPSIKWFHASVLEKPAWSRLSQAQRFSRERVTAHTICCFAMTTIRTLESSHGYCASAVMAPTEPILIFFVMRHLLTLIRMARGVYNSRNFEQL